MNFVNVCHVLACWCWMKKPFQHTMPWLAQSSNWTGDLAVEMQNGVASSESRISPGNIIGVLAHWTWYPRHISSPFTAQTLRWAVNPNRQSIAGDPMTAVVCSIAVLDSTSVSNQAYFIWLCSEVQSALRGVYKRVQVEYKTIFLAHRMSFDAFWLRDR